MEIEERENGMETAAVLGRSRNDVEIEERENGRETAAVLGRSFNAE